MENLITKTRKGKSTKKEVPKVSKMPKVPKMKNNAASTGSGTPSEDSKVGNHKRPKRDESRKH
jgi:hypothetical protein